MAQNAPPSQDVQDIQFKLHDKLTIFDEGGDVKSLVSLLAVSSTKGLLFAGHPNSKKMKVFKLRDLVDSKTKGQNVQVRIINLLGEPKVLSSSCDGSMLAINYVLNNTGFLQIYQVESFVTPTINSLYNIPIAPESNAFALQLLWNPVIPNNIAVILNVGSVTMFTLNNDSQYDKVTLSKEHQVKSGCWSPKGKQIVFGFAEGKLQQFKPNLQAARAIPCPAGIHPGPFDCIAVHWLSTFQFAVIFLQRGQDMCPSLFIVNAPKSGPLSYINYYDICYSAPGPRIQQLSFHHIAQWNLLLVTSANGVEVGVLGTKDATEIPNWIQYTLLDEARIEMPLTESKDETYPLGFAFDTASLHQVAIGDKKLNIMPMIHVLSTHGHLVSYNFLNLSPNAVDICSPPLPLNDITDQFVSLSETLIVEPVSVPPIQVGPGVNTSELGALNKPHNSGQGFDNITFALGSNLVTSTPTIKDKPVAVFAPQPAAPKTTSFSFSTTTPASSAIIASGGISAPSAAPFSQQFSGMTTETSYGGFSSTGFAAKALESNHPPPQQMTTQTPNTIQNSEVNKPLYTVQPTFTPPNVPQQQSVNKVEAKPVKPVVSSNKVNLNMGEIDEVVNQMILLQIEAFETEMRQIRQQSQQLMENIGSPDSIKPYTKKLNDLQEIVEQANDHGFEQDVQSLRQSMNESYAMLAECRTKLDSYNNPNLTRLSTVSCTDPTNRRQLAKLQAYVTSNQNQLSQLNQLIDAQWSQYQDVVRRNSKNQMHVPCLDGIYQRMSKLKDLLSRQRTKMNYIKTKLKQKGLNYKPANDVDVTLAAVGALTKNQSTMESLADSILSMSLLQVVSHTQAKLSREKLNAIRNFTKRQQQIAIIKPKRPDRVGLKSEVILETKLETERKQKEMAKKQQQQQQQQQHQTSVYKTQTNIQQQQNCQTRLQQELWRPQATLSAFQQHPQPMLARPTASKPSAVSWQTYNFLNSPTAATALFPGNRPFFQTPMTDQKTEEISKPIPTSIPFARFSMADLNFNQSKPILNTLASVGNESNENKTSATPISFSANVIGGNDAKPLTSSANKTTAQNNIVQPTSQGFGPPTSMAFSAFPATTSVAEACSQVNDAAKKPEETSKQFSFATVSTATTAISSAPTEVSIKATTTQLLVSNTPTVTSTPFAAVSTPSPFPFNATASATKNSSTKAITSTTSLSHPAGVDTAKTTETKTLTINSSTSTGSTPATSTPASFNIPIAANITASGTKSSAVPNTTITEAKPAVTTSTSSNTTSPIMKEDPTDSLFDSLNICKPTTKDSGDSNKTANIFSGFAAATSTASAGPFSFASASGAVDGPKSFLSSTSTTARTGFSFAAAANTTTTAVNVFEKPAKTETAPTTSDTGTSNTSSELSATQTVTGGSALTTTGTFAFGTTTPATPSTAGSLFSSLSVSSVTAASTTSANTSGNIFGGSSLFGQATTTATTTTTTSVFAGGATVASSAPSLFSSTASSGTTATAGSGLIFSTSSGSTPQSAGCIFGGIPQPEQSVFGATNIATQPAGTGLFAAAAANSKPAAAAGGNIFSGGTSTGFGCSTGDTIFGGAATSNQFGVTSPTNTAGSIFGTAITNPAEGGSIFSSPTQQSTASGGSIFGKSTFGSTAAQQPAGSIFGGGNAQSPTSGGFGDSAGSIFGGSTSANRTASGRSLFGSTAVATAPAFGASTTSTGFGSFSQPADPAFRFPSAGAFGAPAPAGFGSPQQQSAFAKPIFGGSATFGSSQPAFGAQPTFGGAPTFGSPKGFGSFAATSPSASGFGAATQGTAEPKGNIFETLGSQDSGLSFGNLAHSTQASQPKPSFGGSSFMNYRS